MLSTSREPNSKVHPRQHFFSLYRRCKKRGWDISPEALPWLGRSWSNFSCPAQMLHARQMTRKSTSRSSALRALQQLVRVLQGCRKQIPQWVSQSSCSAGAGAIALSSTDTSCRAADELFHVQKLCLAAAHDRVQHRYLSSSTPSLVLVRHDFLAACGAAAFACPSGSPTCAHVLERL